ncbi:hypothetical protein HID58_071824 [Brassica napus]|uniref:Sulfurtransferase n=1 Tax=Brassica napus TaxID=3708 RepID=A0ABQ7Z2X2_BRANA|nr:hypothetical protein HID58_071824 [Brassica napus]
MTQLHCNGDIMASTLFSRTFLAASHRLITPSLLPQKTLNLASFLTRRGLFSQLGSYSTAYRSARAMASAGIGARAGFSTSSSVPTNEPVVSVDWLHSNLREPDLKLPHMLPSEEAFAAGCSALGIENKDGVVVYDAKGVFSAARVWWMFRVFGHDKVWVLDGGLPRWRASGYDVESSASGDAILKASAASEAIEKIYQGHSVSPITFQTKFQPHLVWTLDQVKNNMEDQTYQHVDARSKARFDGTAPEPRKGIRSGHIPGSKCVPYPQLFDSASQTLLPAEDLKKRFEQEEISLDKPIMASCGTGVTACILAMGLHRVGKTDVPVYDGSWTEWATQPDLPMEGEDSSS